MMRAERSVARCSRDPAAARYCAWYGGTLTRSCGLQPAEARESGPSTRTRRVKLQASSDGFAATSFNDTTSVTPFPKAAAAKFARQPSQLSASELKTCQQSEVKRATPSLHTLCIRAEFRAESCPRDPLFTRRGEPLVAAALSHPQQGRWLRTALVGGSPVR